MVVVVVKSIAFLLSPFALLPSLCSFFSLTRFLVYSLLNRDNSFSIDQARFTTPTILAVIQNQGKKNIAWCLFLLLRMQPASFFWSALGWRLLSFALFVLSFGI